MKSLANYLFYNETKFNLVLHADFSNLQLDERRKRFEIDSNQV